MDPYKHTIATWDQVARKYQEIFMEDTLYNATYDIFCEAIAALPAHVLEIGCGPGNITRYLRAKRPDDDLLATDVSSAMVELALENLPGLNVKVLDCREIDRLDPGYDGIMCGFVLPYLDQKEALKLITSCWCLLNSGGILYLSFIEGDYAASGYTSDSSGKHTMYMYFYQRAEIQEWLLRQGFVLLAAPVVDVVKKDDTVAIYPIFIVQKPG